MSSIPEPPRWPLPRVRYFVLVLAVLLVAWVTILVVREVRRHNILIAQRPRIDVYTGSALPEFIAKKLPEEWKKKWLVSAWKVEIFVDEETDAGADYQQALNFPEISELQLGGTTISAEAVNHAGRLKNLAAIEIWGEKISGGWEGLTDLKRLKSLTIRADAVEMRGVSKLPYLEELDFTGQTLTDPQLEEVSNCPSLRRLSLHFDERITGSLARLEKAANLRELMIYTPDGSVTLDLGTLHQLTGLTLRFEGAEVIDKYMLALLSLKNLNRLDVRFSHLDESLRRLDELPRLEVLHLNGGRIPKLAFLSLAKVHRLKWLMVRCGIPNPGGQPLTPLQRQTLADKLSKCHDKVDIQFH